jgi:hypothetical protein
MAVFISKILGLNTYRRKSVGSFNASAFSHLRNLALPRSMIAIFMAFSLSAAPVNVSSAHDSIALIQAESVRHAALGAAVIEREHGHSHEDGTEDEQAAGHIHGHDPADHSHQFAYICSNSDFWTVGEPKSWPNLLVDLVHTRATYGIDRPPKRVLTV